MISAPVIDKRANSAVDRRLQQGVADL